MVDEKQTEEQDQPGGSEDEAPQTISLFLAIGLVIGALVVGLVIGYVAAPKGTTGTTAPNGTQSAPPLSPGQAEKGQLPPGHPSVPGLGGGSTGTTGSAETPPSTAP